jgi:superfamily II DNA or RNA helicase
MLKQAIAEGAKRPVLQAPTGFGKTVVAAHVVLGALRKGKRLVFMVPSISLIDQTFERFAANGIDPGDMGILQGSHPWQRPNAPIQIATAQTISRRDRPDTDIVFVDEAHVMHKVIADWMESHPDVLFIGATATPWSRGLGQRFDKLIKPTSIAELIEGGHLSPFRVFVPSVPDLNGVKTIAGDYHEGQLEKVMTGKTLVGDIVSTWLNKAKGLPTLVFCVTRRHAKIVQEQFLTHGVEAEYCDLDTSREERSELGRRLGAGEIEVVCNVGTLTTGVDWDVRCIVMARPTKSEILFVQIVGRGLRTAPGKEHCLILDHSDTHTRLGRVTEIDLPLDDGKPIDPAERKQKDALPKMRVCPHCTALMSWLDETCGECGWKPPLPVHTVDGGLEEWRPGEKVPKRKRYWREDEATLLEQFFRQGKREIFRQLDNYARSRGYSDGWTAHKFKVIFGNWPQRSAYWDVHQGTTDGGWSYDLERWIKSQNIAFAKRKKQ